MSDVLLLSRFQFAITVFYHFLFVPLTIGLIVLIAWMETQHVRTKKSALSTNGRFLGEIVCY